MEFEKRLLNGLNRMQKDPFLKNKRILTPKRDSHESHLASTKQPFFHISLVAQVYNTIIRVPPSPRPSIFQQVP